MNPVAEKIIAEAREEAARVISDGREKCAAVRLRREEEYNSIRKEGEERIRTEALSLFRQKDAISTREVRLDLLREKRRIIDDTVKSLESEILSDPALYRKVMLSIISRAVVTGNEEIVPCGEDVSMYTPDFIEEARRMVREKTGVEAELKVAPDSISRKGLLIRHGRTVADCRLSVIISEAVRGSESELAAILFGVDNVR